GPGASAAARHVPRLTSTWSSRSARSIRQAAAPLACRASTPNWRARERPVGASASRASCGVPVWSGAIAGARFTRRGAIHRPSWPRTWSSARSRHPSSTRSGSLLARTCRLSLRASCCWPSSWTRSVAGSWAGPWRITCAPTWSWPRWRWPSGTGDRARGSFTTPTMAASTPRCSSGNAAGRSASAAPGARSATAMTTPWPRVSSPPWSANSSLVSRSRPRSRPARPSLSTSKSSTTGSAAIRRSATSRRTPMKGDASPKHRLSPNANLSTKPGQLQKTVLLDMETGHPHWHPRFQELVGALGISPRVCKSYTPQTKGKGERSVGVVKHACWPGVRFTDGEDLNQQAAVWCAQVNGRGHRTTHQRPVDRWGEEGLRAVPAGWAWERFTAEERRVSWDGYLSFAGVLSGLPSHLALAGRRVQVRVHDGSLRVWHQGQVVLTVALRSQSGGVAPHPEQSRPLLPAAAARRESVPVGHQIPAPRVTQRPLADDDWLCGIPAAPPLSARAADREEVAS